STASSYLTMALSGNLVRTASPARLSDQLAVAHVDQKILSALRNDPQIMFIVRDEALPPTVEEETSLIGSSPVWSMGHSGRGTTIAILDTGVDGAHPMLTGKIVAEACFSVADPSSHSVSLCRGGADLGNGDWVDTSRGAGVPCGSSILGCEHGT